MQQQTTTTQTVQIVDLIVGFINRNFLSPVKNVRPAKKTTSTVESTKMGDKYLCLNQLKERAIAASTANTPAAHTIASSGWLRLKY